MRKAEVTARDRLLAATSELFNRRGVQAIGVDGIVDRAGVAKATLYKHFRSKDELILAWLRGPQARWLDRVIVEVDGASDDPAQRLTAVFDVMERWFESDSFQGCAFENTSAEVRDPRSEIRGEIRSYLNEVQAWLSRLLREAGFDDRQLAPQLHAVIAGTIWLAFATSSPHEVADAGRDAMRRLLDHR